MSAIDKRARLLGDQMDRPSAALGGAKSTSDAFRMSTAGRLRSLLMDGSEPVLLLGAGASITSGVPAAAQNFRAGRPVGLVQGEWSTSGRRLD
jgi:hypothetical protein